VLFTFVVLVIVGLGNKVFQKLQTINMRNYPYFLSIYTTFIYIPLSFAYIWPMIIWGSEITPEQRAIPWFKWAIMGSLDGIAGVMQVFAVNYIPSGALIILLTQSAIPISMIITKVMLKAKYVYQHYIGASIVGGGIILVLVPRMLSSNNDDNHGESNGAILMWCGVMILSCIPMTLSSVYKEKALGEVEIDVVYMNGWVAVYQFLISLPLAIPAAYAANLTITDIPSNIWNGILCYVGKNTILEDTTNSDGKITVYADECGMAPLYVNAYVFFNVLYNIFIIMVLKYGSANLLWLAMTFMVPLGNLAFALPFVPEHQSPTPFDLVGLVLIMFGLIIYRFWTPLWNMISHNCRKRKTISPIQTIK